MDLTSEDVKKEESSVCGENLPLCARLERDTGKNAISLATEMVVKSTAKSVEYVCEEVLINNMTHFVMTCSVFDNTFRGDPCASKKGAKVSCARYLIEHILQEEAKNPGVQPLSSPTVIFERSDTFSELLRQHTYAKFGQLCEEYPALIGTDRVIASLFLLDSKGDRAEMISISTGNKCISGDKLSLCGTTLNDSHAEILCRRGLLRFLYVQVLAFYTDSKDCIFMLDEKTKKLSLKPRFSLHMFLNTAPCGSARLYTQSVDEENKESASLMEKESERNSGKLRHKIENGMGTVLGGPDFSVLTVDGMSMGQRLRTQSCSDKLLKWSALGMQGALLSHFINPIYLASLSIAELFSPRVSRAISGRLDGLKLTEPFSLHHSLCMPCQSISPTLCRRVGISPPSVCSNWNIVDGSVETVNTTSGRVAVTHEVSRLSRVSMFFLFCKVTKEVTGQPVEGSLAYIEAKASASAYWSSRKQLNAFISQKGMGKWSNKPFECAQFTADCAQKLWSHVPQIERV